MVVTTIAVFFIGLSPHLTETIFAGGTYPLTARLQRVASGFFPFAIGDFLYILLFIWVVYYLVRRFKTNKHSKHSFKANTLSLAKILVILYLLFKISWGLNYARPAVATRLNIGNKKYDTVALAKLANQFANKMMRIRPLLNPAQKPTSFASLVKETVNSYQKMAYSNSVFIYKNPAIKPVLFTTMISKMGIEGYYNPLSGEANVNTLLPWFVLPFTTCHEVAHQTGIAKEDEANLVGFLTAINSDNPYFQYAGYYNVFRNILFELRIKSPLAYQKLYQRLSPGILSDFATERAFWAKYNSNMSNYTSAAFDQILKLNNQKKGIKSYQDIVLWVYNWNLKARRL